MSPEAMLTLPSGVAGPRDRDCLADLPPVSMVSMWGIAADPLKNCDGEND
jgi:hypothetical protein